MWDGRVMAVLDRLTGAGYRAVLVGGCVRDHLMGLSPHDYDVATAALPQEVASACSGLQIVETGLKHGTVTVLSGGLPVEVTTFRTEGCYTDHRRPDRVDFTGDLMQDLARRDFTMNAIAWERSGLTDPFGGQADLERRLICCVGEPDRRFQEDALRLLRGLRFAAQLEFTLEADTASAIRHNLPLLAHVSQERVTQELLRLICGPAGGHVLLEYPEVFSAILPELAPAVGFCQQNPHHGYDVYTHSVRVMQGIPPEPRLRLAALLHDVAKPECFTLDPQGVGHFYGHAAVGAQRADTLLRRLKVDRATRERVVALIRCHDKRIPPEEVQIRAWLRRLGPELFFDWLALVQADAGGKFPDRAPGMQRWERVEGLAREILARGDCICLGDLEADGRDAVARGLRGPAVGRALNALLDAVVEGRLPNRREALLGELEHLAGEAGAGIKLE